MPDHKHDLNQLRTEPWIQNKMRGRVIKMLELMVSKPAERSRMQRCNTFCNPSALMRWFYQYHLAVIYWLTGY